MRRDFGKPNLRLSTGIGLLCLTNDPFVTHSQLVAALRAPAFLVAFRDKAPMRALVERMPVHVILHKDTGLLGAAVAAAQLS